MCNDLNPLSLLTKGGTVVPPSDFQSDLTKLPMYQYFAKKFFRGRACASICVREENQVLIKKELRN